MKKTKDEDTNNQNSNNFLSGSMIANLIVFVGFALFAVTVNYVIKAVSPEEDGTWLLGNDQLRCWLRPWFYLSRVLFLCGILKFYSRNIIVSMIRNVALILTLKYLFFATIDSVLEV